MTRVLRPYQQSCVAQVRALWDRGIDRVIVCLPTGAGKTELAAELADPFKHPVAMAHSRALVAQLQRRLNIPVDTIQGLRSRQEKAPGEPLWERPPDLVIWDEIHHGDSADWQCIFAAIPVGCKMLGPTATPWRFSHGVQRKLGKDTEGLAIGGAKNAKHGQGLGDLFGAMIVGATPRQLVKDNYLVPLKTVNVVEAQDAAARRQGKQGPSWDPKREKYTGRVSANSDLRLDPVDAWLRHGEQRKAICYSHLIPAAERTAQRFNDLGVPALVVHGKLSSEECERRMAAFQRNEVRILVNVMQLTEGYDCPDVQCIIIDRGANNLNTYLQICGRGARPAPGKTDCLVLDLTGCSAAHGDPQKDQDYWVVTSEGRAVSDVRCEVCGTRVSPMFPTRCMRCDPFRPKLGDPKELLDTGVRIYCLLKDIRDSEEWSGASEDERDARVISELALLDTTTEAETATRDYEIKEAQGRIAQRKQRAEEEKLRAERREQEEKARVDLLARAAERAAARAGEMAEAQRRAAEKNAPIAGAEREQLTTKLRHALATNIRRGWTIGGAIRDVRNSVPRFAQLFPRDSYTIPEQMKPMLREIQATWDGGESPAEFEMRRMLADQRTMKYGSKWCQKKVEETFGKWTPRKTAIAEPNDMS